MTTFVLIGGFWIGAWAWRDVALRLAGAGHRAVAVDLTGLGARRAEAGPEVGLGTHIDDVVGAILRDDLRDVVLVGHSAGGAIVYGVADRVPDRVAGIIFVDTGPVPEGQSIADFGGPDARAETEASAVDGWRLPLPSWEELGEDQLAGLDAGKRAWFRENAADEPVRVATDHVRLTGGIPADMPRWVILCSIPVEAVRGMIAGGHPWFAGMDGPAWTLLSLPTGHWPMMSKPTELAGMIASWPDAGAASRLRTAS